jgi:hypothetical protein
VQDHLDAERAELTELALLHVGEDVAVLDLNSPEKEKLRKRI